MRTQLAPLAAVWRGLIAGAAGAAAQTLFFRLTARLAPSAPDGAFDPPEPQQRDETATATVARRVAGLAAREPLSERGKKRGSRLVHFAFGGLWGSLYGAVRESTPALRRPAGAVAYATTVWFVSDNLLLPAFKLAGSPRRYPARNHAYAWLAHIAYGTAVACVYELLRRYSAAPLAATGWLAYQRWRLRRRSPRWLRPGIGAASSALAPLARQLARARSGSAALRW
jgi:hypothetical protein